jgi:hypothetical protein
MHFKGVNMMKHWILVGCAASVLSTVVVVGAQTTDTAEVVVTVSGCLAKDNKSQYTLIDAKTEKNTPGAPVTTTWIVDVENRVASILGLDQRVGQRLAVVGRVNAEASKTAGATLQVQTLQPTTGTCPGRGST